jgi:hypothetical protein
MEFKDYNQMKLCSKNIANPDVTIYFQNLISLGTDLVVYISIYILCIIIYLTVTFSE